MASQHQFSRESWPSCSIELLRDIAITFSRKVLPQHWVWLNGAMGAGKTTFASRLISHLSDHSFSGSPTFPILTSYPTTQRVQKEQRLTTIFHADLYRIERIDELLFLGLDSEWNSGSLMLVEWGWRFSESDWTRLLTQLQIPTPEVSWHIQLIQKPNLPEERACQIIEYKGLVAPLSAEDYARDEGAPSDV